MTIRPRLAAGIVLALCALPVALVLSADGARNTVQSAPTNAWYFPLESVEDHRRDPGAASMYGLLFQVTESGTPSLDRAFRVSGQVPLSREHPDWGRVYEWRVVSKKGEVLQKGEFFDRLFHYTHNEDGGCDKHVEGAHVMMLRVPAVAGAVGVRLSIVRETTDLEMN